MSADMSGKNAILISSLDTLQSLLDSRWKPDFKPCTILVRRALLSSRRGQTALTDLSVARVLACDHPLSVAATRQLDRGKRRPSALLVCHIQPLSGLVATSRVLSSPTPDLSMIFPGETQGVSFNALFDSGSTNCIISIDLCRQLGLSPISSPYNSVSLASGQSNQVLGMVHLPDVLWGKSKSLGISTPVPNCLVMSTVLPNVPLIIGEDFLRAQHVCLDYGTGRASLGALSRYRSKRCHINGRAPVPTTRGTSSPLPRESESPAPVPSCSAAAATRYMRSGAQAFLLTVKAVAPPAAAHDDWRSRLPDMSHLSEASKAQVLEVLARHADIFPVKPPPGLPPNVLPGRLFPLKPGSVPPYKRSYRLSPGESAELQRQINDLLERGLIEPSASPFGSPVILVKKKDLPGGGPGSGGYRVVYDYRQVNALCVRNHQPLGRIDDLLNEFQGAKVWSSIDGQSAYNLWALDPEDVPATAFSTPFGHYQWRVCPFGASNAPALFSQGMRSILAPFLGKFCTLYLDDVCVYSASDGEHLHHLDLVLTALRNAHIYLGLPKCSFMTKSLKFLGWIVSPEGLTADPSKLSSVQTWPYPKNVKELQRFLGLANYFRIFCPNFSRVAVPLFHLTKKSVPWSDSSECRTAFELIKQMLISPPVLAFPNPELPYTIISDASISGCGAVLVQEGRPVAYFSSKFSPAERNYTTTEVELLGVIKCLREWRCFVEGCKGLTICTDHSANTFLPTQYMLSGRQARWAEFLSRFKIDWKHIPGKSNPADSLSRLYCNLVVAGSVAALADLHPDLVGRFPNQYQYDDQFSSRAFVDKYQLNWTRGLWVTPENRVAVPKPLVQDLLIAHHSSVLAGHRGVTATLDLVRRHFWWHGMTEDVKRFVSECPQCQAAKSSHQLPAGLLQSLDIPDTRFETVSLDFVTGLPKSRSGHDAVLVMVDKTSGMVHIAACTTKCSAEQSATLLHQNIIRLHGVPKNLLSDRDPRFTSAYWKSMCDKMGIKNLFSTAYHPATNATTERVNQVVEEVLRGLLGTHNQRSWESLLPFVEFAINNAKSASSGFSPFFLVYGAHPRTPVSNSLDDLSDLPIPALKDVLQNMESTLEQAKQLRLAAVDRQATYANLSRRPHTFTAGQPVLLSSKNFRLHGKGRRKLFPRFLGPFVITSMVGRNAARLQLPPSWAMHNVFHVSLLKPFKGTVPDSELLEQLPLAADASPQFAIQHILGHRSRSRGSRSFQQFLVQWKDLSPEHASWEDRDSLPDDAVDQYLRLVQPA